MGEPKHTCPRKDGRLAAGPRLARAADGVAAASRHWTGATTLTGTEAFAASVSELAGRVDLAVPGGARASVVAENPLFSNLELVDGPWFGYDLDQLQMAWRP